MIVFDLAARCSDCIIIVKLSIVGPIKRIKYPVWIVLQNILLTLYITITETKRSQCGRNRNELSLLFEFLCTFGYEVITLCSLLNEIVFLVYCG